MKSSKLTTICGAVGVVAGVIVTYDFGHIATKVAGCIGACATGLGLYFARDNKVSDEQAGAKAPIVNTDDHAKQMGNP